MSPGRAWSDSLRDQVDALKRAVDLRDLFMERYPGRFRRSGKWLYGTSPYREDRHPSFAVNEDVFIDFATGERGDEVDFLMRERGLSFREAVEELAARADGLKLTAAAAPPHEISAGLSEPPPAVWQEILTEECRRAHDFLFSNAAGARTALAWLTGRGLKRHTLRAAGIGANPAWRETRLRERESGRPVLIPPGILIPCYTDGALWSVHVRTLPGQLSSPEKTSLPKYIYVRGSRTGGLYNGDALYPGCTVLIVEGEFDALLAAQELGKRAVVVTLGSAANRIPRRWLSRLQEARHLHSCLDQDAAGERATRLLAEQLGEHHTHLTLPHGKDITEFVVEHGGNLAKWWRVQTLGAEPKPVQLPLPDSPSHTTADE